MRFTFYHILAALFAGSILHGAINPTLAETSKKDDAPACVKTEEITKMMNDKGFFHLLNMTNTHDVIETIWVSGDAVVITAQEKETSCVIAMMKDVVYNPNTIEGLLKAYQNQSSKQKDI